MSIATLKVAYDTQIQDDNTLNLKIKIETFQSVNQFIW